MEEQFQQLPAAPFPAPPPFWKHFTEENLSKLATIQENESSTQEDKQEPIKLPLELTYLIPPPPPPPTATIYTTFSIPQSLNPTPAPPPTDILLFDPQSQSLQGPTSSSTPLNPATLLTRLTKSALLNFLELTTILGTDPMGYEEKLSDINRIMLNIHYVINLYRPHQAREGVREMLMARLEDGRREIERCDEVKGRVEGVLRRLEGGKDVDAGSTTTATGLNGLVNGMKKMEEKTTTTTTTTTTTKEEVEESKRLWSLIYEIEDE